MNAQTNPHYGANASLEDMANKVKELAEKITGTNRLSMEVHRDMGFILNDAKEVLKDNKGAFGKWCEESGFTFNKTWRARLMKLAERWDDYRKALNLLGDNGGKAYTVDGALALLRAYDVEMDPEAKAKAEAEAEAKANGSGSGEGEGAGEGEGTQIDEKAQLKAELKAALRRIRELEKELDKAAKAKAKAEEKAQAEEAKAKAKADKANEGAQSEANPSQEDPTRDFKVSAKDKALIRKVHALATNGGTDGEKSAAMERLIAIANRYTCTVAELLAACELSM